MTNPNKKDQVPEFIKSSYGKSVAEILKSKSDGPHEREAVQKASPKLVTITPDECKKLCKTAGVEYEEGYEKRVLSYICSDESVDRYGDIIRQDGWDLKAFKSNPVVMGFHDYGTFPVGNAVKVWTEDNKLKMWILFAGKEISEDADLAFRMAKSGFMKAGSVGFIPKSVKNPSAEERKDLGMTPWGVIFEKQELLEHTVCGVPANSNALQEAVSKGVVSNDELKRWYRKDTNAEKKETGVTGTSNEHNHPYTVDEEGNGLAAKGDSDHTHIIADYIVEENEGHTHSVKKPEKSDDDSEKEKSITFSKKDLGDLISSELTKALEGISEEKAGAVLSKKNKQLITNAIDTMASAQAALQKLVDSATPEPAKDDKDQTDPDNQKDMSSDSKLLDFTDEEETEEADMYRAIENLNAMSNEFKNIPKEKQHG